jgi:bacillolysin
VRSRWLFAFSVGVLSVAVWQRPSAAPAATQGTRTVIEQTSDASTADQRSAADLIETLIDEGQLRLIDRRVDTLLPDRVHERYQQVYRGLPVIGADVATQRRSGQLVSSFGIVFRGLEIETAPQQPASQVAATLRANGFATIGSAAPLSILPTADGRVALVYAFRSDDGFVAFVDAADATVLAKLTERHTQAAVGQATGTLGDSKKISVTNQNGTFVTQDALRPPALQTYDLQGNFDRVIAVVTGRGALSNTELGQKSDNVWTDGAVVDAHVHTGWVYDYYYRRFQRRGLDNNDVRIQSIVHPVRLQDYRAASATLGPLYLNAFYNTACRCVVYGEGAPPGVNPAFPGGVRNFATALDVVGHELTHAVTDSSSRLAYVNESGALNEAFSDIIGASIEFLYHSAASSAVRADYLMGEDLAPSGTGLLRSMSAPTDYGQPDHFFARAYIGATSADFDSGGVHVNSGIANNAFYLAVEGGTHRASRRVVTGVGAANRDQIERVFYRAFTAMLPSAATFYLARTATIQSARDLYGINSAAERAVSQAWDAVGVVSPAAALTTQFSPRSVSANTNACSAGGPRPSFNFRVSVSEFQRVGFTVSSFNIYSYDSAIRQIGAESFPAATFRSWFNECQAGSTRIGGGATACASLCGHLGGRASGYAIFEFAGADDNGNPGVFNSDVISLGLPARAEADGEFTTPTFAKVSQ